jgi:hypothetical protein
MRMVPAGVTGSPRRAGFDAPLFGWSGETLKKAHGSIRREEIGLWTQISSSVEIGRKGLLILNQANPSGAPSLQPLRLHGCRGRRWREGESSEPIAKSKVRARQGDEFGLACSNVQY